MAPTSTSILKTIYIFFFWMWTNTLFFDKKNRGDKLNISHLLLFQPYLMRQAVNLAAINRAKQSSSWKIFCYLPVLNKDKTQTRL